MTTTPDLFADPIVASPTEYLNAFDEWLAADSASVSPMRPSSVAVFRSMWMAFTAWSVGRGIALDDIAVQDLSGYLSSRGGADELTPRYAWRMLRLLDQVLLRRSTAQKRPRNTAAREFIAARPDIRFANAADGEPAVDYLPAAQAKALVTYLCAIRPGKRPAGMLWPDVRNLASVGLMLGAGITPGEVRHLNVDDVVIDGGRSLGIPWKLKVPGTGDGPRRETPMSPWAGQMLRCWLDVREQQGIPGPVLFPAIRPLGKAWGKVAQYNACKAVLVAAGVEHEQGGSFRLRHTFAIRQLRRGTAPKEVMRWLGVTQPAVMARYQRVVAAPVDVA